MKRKYEVPEITMIEFTARDMVTESLMGSGFEENKANDTEVDASYIFGP